MYSGEKNAIILARRLGGYLQYDRKTFAKMLTINAIGGGWEKGTKTIREEGVIIRYMMN